MKLFILFLSFSFIISSFAQNGTGSVGGRPEKNDESEIFLYKNAQVVKISKAIEEKIKNCPRLKYKKIYDIIQIYDLLSEELNTCHKCQAEEACDILDDNIKSLIKKFLRDSGYSSYMSQAHPKTNAILFKFKFELLLTEGPPK